MGRRRNAHPHPDKFLLANASPSPETHFGQAQTWHCRPSEKEEAKFSALSAVPGSTSAFCPSSKALTLSWQKGPGPQSQSMLGVLPPGKERELLAYSCLCGPYRKASLGPRRCFLMIRVRLWLFQKNATEEMCLLCYTYPQYSKSLHTLNLWTLCFKVCLLKIQLISVTIPPLIKYLTAACIWMNASYETGRCSLPHVESALSSLLSPSHTLPHTSESLCLAESRMMRAGREEFCPVENRPPGSESLWHFYRLWAFSTYLSLQLRAESAPEWDF